MQVCGAGLAALRTLFMFLHVSSQVEKELRITEPKPELMLPLAGLISSLLFPIYPPTRPASKTSEAFSPLISVIISLASIKMENVEQRADKQPPPPPRPPVG